jgi:thiol:disulfide interchange protein
MLKAILLLLLSFAALAEEYATYSLTRWQDKLVVTIDHDKGWHTYWKNPGDAGIASTFKFFQAGKPLEVKAFEWPAPKRYIESGDILTIGYSDTQHFFFESRTGDIEAHIGVLICKDICIPGEAKLKLNAKDQTVSSRKGKSFSESDFKKAFSVLPQAVSLPEGFEYYLTRVKDQPSLTLHYSLKGVNSANLPKELPLLTGFPKAPWGFKRETLYFKDGILYGKMEIEWDGEYQEPPIDLPADGNFKNPWKLDFLYNGPDQDKVGVVTLEVKNFSLATPALDDFYKGLGKADKPQVTSTDKSYLEYILFAFLGGLILNLMPCVLPVISLKLFGLIRHSEYTQRKLFTHNLSYTAGVISTFMVLGGVVVGLKVAGEEIGWGFQLQSPAFILVMMLILFIMSLNLFGLFEFITPGGSKIGSAKTEEGFSGDFFTGVLTTILSTPCSAPFLGTALTFAFTTSSSTIFIMFFFIGLGLAFPFLMTAVFPKTLAVFPKPGAWMEKLKYFLGLSLVATVIWLYDVFVGLTHFEVISWRLNILFLFWFFAFFFVKKISHGLLPKIAVFALPSLLTLFAIQNLEIRPVSDQAQTRLESEWKPWTEEFMKAEKGKYVFIDFTAEWCLTCKVNKKLVLETDAFKEMAKKENLLLMRADWTKRDDNITQFLKKNGAVGVPAYFIQRPDGTITPLGETISVGKIQEHLR